MKLTKVDLIENLTGELDVCRIEIDGGAESAFIIWNHTNMLTYLDEEIICTFRQDIYKGTPQKFVNTLAKVGVVQTLAREDNIKLFADKQDNHCNISFRDIGEDQTVNNAVVYVVDVVTDSNARTSWWDFKVQDKDRRLSTIRMFSPTGSDTEYRGRYIMCDIHRNKYGLSTQAVTTIDTAFAYSPEVTIAESFINKAFADDAAVLQDMQSLNFISTAKAYVAEEPGYLLVRLAMELDLANEMANLTGDVDMALIKQTLLLDKFWVLQSASPFRRDIVAYAMGSRAKFPNKREAMQILYSDAEEFAAPRTMVNSIKQMVDNLVKLKKGLV